MRLESTIADIHGAGAEVVAVSVNEEARQAGMAERWKLANIKLVGDEGGDSILKSLDLFDPEDRGGIALPSMIVVGPDGTEVYRYNGRDFADRTTDDDVMEAVRGLNLDPINPDPWVPEATVPDDLSGFFPVERYQAYFAGNRFGAIAIGGRLPDKETAAIAREHRLMAEASLAAFDQLNA